MITQANIWGAQKDLANVGIFNTQGAGAPVNGTSGTGVGITGPGSTYFDTTGGNMYNQVGTLASPSWALIDGFSTIQQVSGTISAANIVATTAGAFGHANGVIMLAAPGAHVVNEVISCVLLYKFATAAYTAGGNITVNNGAGGAAITGLVSAANSVGAASSKVVFFVPLSTVGIALVENGPINLVSSAAFTQPGTAAGTITWYLNYRQYNTGF